MEVKGWKLYAHELFLVQLQRLMAEVTELQKRDLDDYELHPKTKFLATINQLIRETIPNDPAASLFRQGKTLGKSNQHWFRAKFHAQYRLFFRFSSTHKVIVYVWVNDEKTLRQAGAKTDPYSIFQTMLKQGNPPQNFDQLMKNSVSLDELLGEF
jgi:toxin YhaV